MAHTMQKQSICQRLEASDGQETAVLDETRAADGEFSSPCDESFADQ
jgi:hypothetical protein